MKIRPLRYARRLHLSFLLILLIPLVVTLVLYVYVVRQANEQSDRLHESLLAKVQSDMDARLLTARSVGSRLFIDADVRALSYVDGEMQSIHAMPQVRLYQELNSLVLANDSLSGIFIYYPNAHKVISNSGNMDFSLYYSLYYGRNCLPEEELASLFSGEHHYDMHLVRAKGDTCQLIMLMSLPAESAPRLTSTVGLILSPQMLRTQMTMNELSASGTELYILTRAGEIYSPSAGITSAEGLPVNGSGSASVFFDGENVRTSLRPSAQVDLSYLMVTPARLIHEDVRKLHFVIVLGLLLSILSGLLLSKHLTVSNYDPVDRLLRTIRSGTDETNAAASGVDDLVWASREVEQLYRNSVNNERLLRDSHRQMRDYCLLQLLTKGHVERPELYGLQLSSACFVTVILRVPDAAELKETELALRATILRGLFEEKLKPLCPVEALEWGDAVIALISLPDQEPARLSQVREACEEVQTTVETTLHFSCAVFIGPVAAGVEEIPAAYRSTLDLEEYRPLLDTSVISASEITALRSGYDFSGEDEEKLKNAVSVGNEASALKLLAEIFDRNRRAGISPDLYWCLVYAIAGVLLRGANNGGIRDAAGYLTVHPSLMKRKPGADLENALADIVSGLCREIARAGAEADSDSAFCGEVESFIRDHFTDPDLNISSVSDRFGLTPGYLSARYKRQTGRSLLDFINTSRLDLSESLLKNGLTVSEAAERSGFRDSSSLIRAFKKKKGITPGQVRQMPE